MLFVCGCGFVVVVVVFAVVVVDDDDDDFLGMGVDLLVAGPIR